MKVICKENTAENLDLNEVKHASRTTQYPVRVGSEYIVMGMMIYKNFNCLYYLVSDNNGLPYWIPCELFEISDNTLSPNWFVKVFDKKDVSTNFFYLSGFSELCNDDDYNDDLVLREGDASEIYDKRKAEVEEWYAERELLEWAKKRN